MIDLKEQIKTDAPLIYNIICGLYTPKTPTILPKTKSDNIYHTGKPEDCIACNHKTEAKVINKVIKKTEVKTSEKVDDFIAGLEEDKLNEEDVPF